MFSLELQGDYMIVNTVLRGVMILPTLIIWILGIALARRRDDPARAAFSYWKAACPIFALSLVLLVGGYIAEAVLDKQSFYSLGLTAEELLEDHLDEAIDRLFAVGTFFEYVADILIQICVVELGLGFLYCLQQNRTSLHHILRPCIFIVSFILFVLAIASMGLFNAEYTKEFNYLYALDSSDGSDFGPSVEFDRAAYENGLKAATNLGVAFDVIIFVASVLLVGFSAHVLHKCQQYPALRSSAVLLVVITVLSLLRYTYAVAEDARWIIPETGEPIVVYGVVDELLFVWVFFVILVLILVIGARKQRGLWSKAQPWMTAPVMTVQVMTVPASTGPAVIAGPIQPPVQQMEWKNEPQPQMQSMGYQG